MLPMLQPGSGRRRVSIPRASTTTLFLMAILAAGAYVRLADIDLGWFMLDQARDVRTARAILEGRAFPLVGPAIEGGPSHTWGPLYFYVVALPMAFSRDPAVAAAFLGLLNLLAVYLTYRFGAAFFGPGVGLIAAALFATYPLAVISARALWNVAAVPLVTVAFVSCLFAVVVQRRSAMVVPALLALALAPQLHLAGLSLAIVFVAALLIYRPPVARRHLLLGAGLALVAFLPYLVAVTGRGAPGMGTTLGDLLGRLALRHPGDVADTIRRVFFISWEAAAWMTQRFGGDGSIADWALLYRVESWLMLLGAAYPAWRLGRARAGAAPAPAGDGLLLLWIWIPLLLLSVKRGVLNHYYFDVLYPAPFVGVGILVGDLIAFARSRGRGRAAWALRGAVAAFVALVMGSQAALLHRLQVVTVARGQIPVPNQLLTWGLPVALPDGDSMPIRYRKGIVVSLVAHIGADRDAFVRRVHGMAFEEVLQDKGVFFDWLSGSSPAAARPAIGPGHVAVVRAGPAYAVTGSSVHRVGPFSVVAYTPIIDYASWAYAPAVRASAPDPALTAWTPLPLPTRGAPSEAEPGYPPQFAWPGMPVVVRGTLVTPDPPGPLALVVALVNRQGDEHRVESCRLDDTPIEAEATSRVHTPVATISETVLDLSSRLREGRHTIACLISGHGSAFDLDVYEVRRGATAGEAPPPPRDG